MPGFQTTSTEAAAAVHGSRGACRGIVAACRINRSNQEHMGVGLPAEASDQWAAPSAPLLGGAGPSGYAPVSEDGRDTVASHPPRFPATSPPPPYLAPPGAPPSAAAPPSAPLPQQGTLLCWNRHFDWRGRCLACGRSLACGRCLACSRCVAPPPLQSPSQSRCLSAPPWPPACQCAHRGCACSWTSAAGCPAQPVGCFKQGGGASGRRWTPEPFPALLCPSRPGAGASPARPDPCRLRNCAAPRWLLPLARPVGGRSGRWWVLTLDARFVWHQRA